MLLVDQVDRRALRADQVADPCAFCFSATEPVDLSEALVRDAISQDGQVERVPKSADLTKFDGVAALLRW